MLRSAIFGICLFFVLLPPGGAESPPAPVRVGLDAEFGHRTSTSAQAVQRGLEIAIAEINAAGGVLGGRPLELELRDNRSLTARGVDNLRELAAIPDLVAVFGGKFSPVYVECVPVAHELRIPLMDPWGAADMITDHGIVPSYTYRLSLKDSWAAPVMLRFALERHDARRLGVFLPNTAWGRSNEAAIARAAGELGQTVVAEQWYNWGDASLIDAYREVLAAGAEVVILVANEAEGSVLVREVAALPETQRLPIVSHWGVTGGVFAELSGEALDRVDFAVVQTYSFIGRDDPVAQRVLAALAARYGVAGAEAVKSPVGVAHAYDLMHLLAKAIDAAGSTDRVAIRDALEQLGPHDGLVRRYERPFSPERHDALGPEDVFMARYTSDDRIVPIVD
jgi:branched-chain amino acid transport system substrate-binding protein